MNIFIVENKLYNKNYMHSIEVKFPNIDQPITFYIGQNAQDNFDIIDQSNENDIWFHLKDNPSTHVVAKMPDEINKRQKLTIIKKGALLCKQYTNSIKKMKNIEFLYTSIKHITKLDKPGLVDALNTKSIII